MFRYSFGKKQGTQPALPKGTGFAIIIAVNTMPPHKPEFKEKDEEHIQDGPDEADLVEDSCAN
jgi:hypothetical protein